jgi:serine/threonine protein phosphatase PrpC
MADHGNDARFDGVAQAEIHPLVTLPQRSKAGPALATGVAAESISCLALMSADPSTTSAGARPIVAVMVTDVGVVREHNEDSGYVDPHGQFFIVADGMGGHAAGEVASSMAVDTVRKKLEGHRAAVRAFIAGPTETGRKELVRVLQGSVLAAHQAVFQRGTDEPDKHGMGTTLDVLLLAGSEAFVAHVGDSRTYLLRDGRASQVTTDHTVAEVLVIEGKLTVEEASVSPLRTVLVNALGVSADVGVEMAHLQLRTGDRLLLCSDGLHDYFMEDTEVVDRLGAGEIGERLQAMVELAKERGGHDNITGVAIHVVELSDAVPGLVERDSTLPVSSADADVDWEERTEAAASTSGTREQDIATIRRGAAAAPPLELDDDRRRQGEADTVPPRIRAAGKATDSAEAKTVEQPAVSPELVTALEATAPAAADATTPPPLGTGAPKAPPDATTTLPARGRRSKK